MTTPADSTARAQDQRGGDNVGPPADVAPPVQPTHLPPSDRVHRHDVRSPNRTLNSAPSVKPGTGPIALTDLTGSDPLAGLMQTGFTLCEEIGRGGIGHVSRAEQRVFGRMVAVKQLMNGRASRKEIRKFFAEALIAAHLEHPNIVPIHDLIVGAEGQLQLIMKRVEGLSWGCLLDPSTQYERGRAAAMTLDDHLDILMKVCDAVAFAHGRGILHCDLKPDNVMVGAFGEALVMDWGCAMALVERQYHPLIPCVRTITAPAGTPTFMAPESALAQSDSIGPHSDVYQLGAILYHLLTGQSPNRGEEVAEVMQDAAFGVLVPPQQAAPTRVIPDELADICLQSLHKDPTQRIASVSALIIRLTTYRRHAQAVTLAATSRTLITAARTDSRERDDILRRALSSAEQAYAIWPEWRGASVALVNAQLAHAQHHLDIGACAAAIASSRRAEDLAVSLGLQRQASMADRLAQNATLAERAVRARRLHVHWLRTGLITATSLLVIGLVYSVITVSSAERRMSVALGTAETARVQAEQALSSLTIEQQRRSEDQKRFVPAIIAQARKEMQSKQWDAAARVLESAIVFDEHNAESLALYANALVAGGHYTAARAAIAQWLEAVPGDAQALQLRSLCARAREGVAPDLELKTGLSTVFSAQHLYTLAEEVAVSPQERLELYRARMEAVWPGLGIGLSIRADGLLTTTLERRISLAGHSEVVDISALHGMPFAVLNLSGTQVQDLSPLRGMPLEELNLEHTPVVDLTPLSGLPLTTLLLGSSRVIRLDPLHGLALKRLSVHDTAIASITPLTGMSFTSLDCSHTPVESLAPLAGVAQGEIIARYSHVHALAPLVDTTISILDVTRCHLDDLSVLSMMKVGQFSGLSIKPSELPRISTLRVTGIDFGECPELTSLDLVRGMHLTYLSAFHAHVSDLGPLSGMMLRSLSVPFSQIRSLAPLTGMPITWLNIAHTPIADLEPLRGMPIKSLTIDHTEVSDYGPLTASPLEDIRIGPFHGAPSKSLAMLRQMTSIRLVGMDADQMMPATTFWHSLDIGEIH